VCRGHGRGRPSAGTIDPARPHRRALPGTLGSGSTSTPPTAGRRRSSELADLFGSLEEADSVAIDPHKWMYVPVECGCALVKDAQAMRDAFSLVPPYLRDDTALPWFSEFGIQQSRGFRALKLWTALRHVGLSGYRRLISQDIARTRALQQRLREADDFELVAAGPLSVTCFRYRPATTPPPADADVDRLNRNLLESVQSAGHVFLTGTELHGRFVLRACIVNFRTRESDLDALLDAIRRRTWLSAPTPDYAALSRARQFVPISERKPWCADLPGESRRSCSDRASAPSSTNSDGFGSSA
jgi:hypothetical protein